MSSYISPVTHECYTSSGSDGSEDELSTHSEMSENGERRLNARGECSRVEKFIFKIFL